ncbi:protein FANTASTIC FOUR 4-like [Momordica charantia]|uniref:Protein FANTASTIC FOUR 4-like n=1 Tax=Momordica charantia TaxID=3673 RepID=A0A6J1DJJ5_MOMCH|nr:protein FANTASTIC FOUR 4-like [Momordica charantia]
MAACKSFQHIFERPLPEKQTLLESVMPPWSQNIKPVEQTARSSFSELFDSSQMSTNKNQNEKEHQTKNFSFSFPLGNNHFSCNKNHIGFSSVKSESLQLCTERLGSESSDNVEDLKGEMINETWQIKEKVVSTSLRHFAAGSGRSRTSRESFPPPLSFVGKSGKAGVCFTSYRQDGRFVLKEVRIPSQEFLQAHREDGCLKLQIVQPNDYVEEEDEGDEERDDVVNNNEEYGEDSDVSNVRDNGQS